VKIEADARQVTVFVNSTDQWQERDIAGATVSRCIEGYGAGHQLHTLRLLELTENLPVRIDVIDLPERIDPLLTALDGMIREGLVVVANVRIRRFLPDPKA
jgi:PII-like signaling protein